MAKLVIEEPSHTLAEYLLQPGFKPLGKSEDSVSLTTPLSRFHDGEEPHFVLHNPLTSAIMQAVTGPRLAIALAREGGLGFLPCSQSIESQQAMVAVTKESKAGFVTSKANLAPEATLEQAIGLMRSTGYSTIPITHDGSSHGQLLGILTSTNFWQRVPSKVRERLLPEDLQHSPTDPVRLYMTPIEKLVIGRAGYDLTDANLAMFRSGIKSLPIVNEDGTLRSLVFKSDYLESANYPGQLVDEAKRLKVGAGLNTRDYRERASALLAADVDALCFDSSDGHNEYQGMAIRQVREQLDEHERRTGKRVILGGGNVVTADAFEYLADAGVDFVKWGIGGGSICITREQKGIGLGQATAGQVVAAARDARFKRTGEYIPLVSDGGIVHDPQVMIALAIGADAVMLGRYFARFEESPGPKNIVDGQLRKGYWGEGSNRARNWQRYSESNAPGLKFEEGVDGWVPFGGALEYGVKETLAKLRSSMHSAGCYSIRDFHHNAILRSVSQQTLVENGAHDILVPVEISNYSHQRWGA